MITLVLPYPISGAGIYRITDSKSGRFYIGSSINVAKRWHQHQGRLRRGTHPNPALQAIWNKTPSRLACELIQAVEPTREALLRAEQLALDAARAGTDPACLNVLTVAGSHLGRKRSEATRVAMSAAQRGKTHTAEARARMRAAKLGKKQSDAVRAAQSARQLGKKLATPRRHTPAVWARSLSDDQVRQLRQRRQAGVSWRLLGAEFGLHPSAAKRAALGISYREVV